MKDTRPTPAPTQLARWQPWRLKGIGVLRIVFGLAWAVDACFKWQPDFVRGFTHYLTGSRQGQPAWVKGRIGFWVDIVKVNPHLFAYIVAVAETAVAIGLLLGAFSNIVDALREAGPDRVLMPTGVWDLAALAEGEALMFAREVVAQLFDRLRVSVVWNPTPGSRWSGA